MLSVSLEVYGATEKGQLMVDGLAPRQQPTMRGQTEVSGIRVGYELI